MKDNYLLTCSEAVKIYDRIKDLPIVDYHCHLSPKEIYEDKPYNNIGEMWLSADHYKWRLMRTAGIPEKYITGDAPMKEKFLKYAEAIEFAAGNPLYHWSHMELSKYFGISDELNRETSESIWNRANDYIKVNNLSPRKLLKLSGVVTVCTTDDPADNLEWHKLIREDDSFDIKVLPSYRTDNMMLARREGYSDYIKRLSESSGITVSDLKTLKSAAEKSLDRFVQVGCKVSDVGIPFFPSYVATDDKANRTYCDLLSGKEVSDYDYEGFLGNLYVFFSKLYKERNILMQLHLAVTRNSNSELYGKLGADCGVDCVGDAISGTSLISLLDAMNENGGLPTTVIYTLNPANAAQIASIAGAFPNVHCGAAWWFCDHKRGIEEQIDIIAENSSLGSFFGMLTDSRSFLSYARHDYFRRILASKLGEWVERGEYGETKVFELAERICLTNIKKEVG